MGSLYSGPQQQQQQQHKEEEEEEVIVESSNVVCDVEVKVGSEILWKIEAEVERVMSHMTAHNQGIFLWNLSTLTLLQLQASSWDSFGLSIPNIPSLHRLLLAESKLFKNTKASVGRFISTWKDACNMYTGVQLFEKLLDFYLIKKGKRIELISCFSTSPLIGLLNVAVISIQRGKWDSLSNTFQFNCESMETVDDSVKTFVRSWKEACQAFNTAEAFEKMLDCCGFENQNRSRLRHIFSTFPLVGFLNVAVTSIKSGVWDSWCNTLRSRGEIGHTIKQAEELTGYKSLDVEPDEKDSGISREGLTFQTDISFSLRGTPANISERVTSYQQAGHDFNELEAARIIDSIRREEFGLDPNLSYSESTILKKQHARLRRALDCLSQELYSQDSHFLLELVQNADDNMYPENLEPTLTFILQPTSIVVLNNERGFTAENMRALCDIGNSTKKGSSTGHIGQKGIGFKSVFRVTDTPEIHSNGFHVKFDTSGGQIGFVLPTVLPPCDFEMLQILASGGDVQKGTNTWNTCIMLPLKRELLEGSSLSSVSSMFSDLHPSLLLFLRRLQCIKLRNMLDDSYTVMKKEIVGDGIVRVSHGKEKMTWFVTSTKLYPEMNSSNDHMTEISIALSVKETDNGDYVPLLQHQPVFAFLPLRTYGLKFILQADFFLTSSREEVVGDSPWNQWLLSEFPDLFVNAEKSICSLPCFHENPAKAISVYMSFVPLIGEVHGFFSGLPHMIISKLSKASCLLQDGCKDKWVPPWKVLKGWNEQARTLLPCNLLCEHLGLEFLHKDIDLPEALATALGIQIYGPKTLTQFISSLGCIKDGIKSMGLGWLFTWLSELHSMVLAYAPNSKMLKLDLDLINCLKKVPFIPLSNGTYSSLDDGTIWLHDHISNPGHGEFDSKIFPYLHARLRTVSPALFSESIDLNSTLNCMRMLQDIGVCLMSAHELIRIHILPSISNDIFADNKDHQLMVEYMTFIMHHLQSNCTDCHDDEDHIISELCSKAVILTNYGYKRLDEVPIHFSTEFGNSVDPSKFLHGLDYKWHEIDALYLNSQINKSMSCGLKQWREFFQKLGVTDFVKVVPSEKSIVVLNHITKSKNIISPGLFVEDWESPELVDILSLFSKDGSQERCKYFLEVLDALWDDHFSDKAIGYFRSLGDKNKLYFESSLVSCLSDVKWVVSSADSKLHFPSELFYDCDAVHSVLGSHAPYAVPKLKSVKLSSEMSFKTQVTLDDALAILQTWRSLKSPFTASLSQMSKFYSFIWKETAMSTRKVADAFNSGPFIFVPSSVKQREEVVAGVLLSPEDVYWHDATGAVDHIKEVDLSVLQNCIVSELEKQGESVKNSSIHLNRALCSIYPSLHKFFVAECSVNVAPSFHQYIQILKHLSIVPLSKRVAKMVFRILSQWSFGWECGTLSPDDIVDLKSCISQFSVLPAMQDKWVSAHPSSGLVCWCGDDNLKAEFDHFKSIVVLYFGELTDKETEMLRTRVFVLLQKLGIRSLSDIVSREAICCSPVDSGITTSVIKRVLPFALRYLYNLHRESYNQHKLSGFSKICHLRIVAVEKLFYRNVIITKKIYCISKKRFECSSVLQDNILYTTKDSDLHSIFMELSRLLFDSTPNLHLANFLHMITLMAKSGSTEEQIELFILNQKMVKLPNEESISSLISPLTLLKNDAVVPDSPNINDQISSKSKEKSTSSAPLSVIWKPKSAMKSHTVITKQPDALPSTNDVLDPGPVLFRLLENQTVKVDDLTRSGIVALVDPSDIALESLQLEGEPSESSGSTSQKAVRTGTKGKPTFSSSPAVIWKPKTSAKTQTVITNKDGSLGNNDVSDGILLEKSDTLPGANDVPESGPTLPNILGNQMGRVNGRTSSSMGGAIDAPFDIALESFCVEEDAASEISGKAPVLQSTCSSQNALTGRQGEEAAFRYYTERAGGAAVKWVNQEKETGLPYDILVGEEESKEYIEVKASRNEGKNGFRISRQEWEFAIEKGDSFSVAYVNLSDRNLNNRVTVYKNPVELCQSGEFRLVTLSSKCYFLQRL
ncbi:protein NO VEIN-like [Silene latifolia]|uniref:protein NO VEIN-like n=1 Tax=Silene latifolia TaxID=37657 RepID=UPI003D7839C6